MHLKKEQCVSSRMLHTFKIKSVMETDKYRAILAPTIHFPRPELRGFRDPDLALALAFGVLLLEDLITTSKSHINTCNLGSLEIKPTPSLTKDRRKLGLISPTEIDSTGPCKIDIVVSRRISSSYRH